MSLATETTAVRTARAYNDFSHGWVRRNLLTRETAIIALVVVVYLIATVMVPNFDRPITISYLFLDIAPILLIALPMTLIIITGEIDLSVASMMGLSSVLTGTLTQGGMPFEAACVIALLVGVLGGALNGFLVTVVGLPSLAVTIGTLALYRGLAVGLLGTTAVTEFPKFWTDIAKAKIEGTPIPLIVIPIVILLIIFVLVLHYTPFGRGIYAIGLNDEAAQFSGVNVNRTKLILFILAGVVSAFAGIFYTLRYGSARGDNATGMELQVIAAVLLGGVSIFGGRGALHGVIAGVILIGLLASALRLANVTSDVINIITGVLLVLSVVLTSVLNRIERVRVKPGVPQAAPAAGS